MESSGTLTAYQQGNSVSELSISRPPEVVLEEARRAAKVLRDVVKQTKAMIKLGNSEHLKCEAWQTLGHFYNLVGSIRETRFVQYGDVVGFEAFAELKNSRTGEIVSTAEAMCLNDEERWGTRPKYEWQNNVRVKVGEEKVPLFQLKSMAQTRAISKVHANTLRWVVVLAGYSPTPAEEIDGSTISGSDQPAIQQPKRKSEAAAPPDEIPFDQLSSTPPAQAAPPSQPALPTNGNVITEKQVGRMYAIARGAGYTDETFHAALAKMNYKSSKDVTKANYEDVCAFFSQKP